MLLLWARGDPIYAEVKSARTGLNQLVANRHTLPCTRDVAVRLLTLFIADAINVYEMRKDQIYKIIMVIDSDTHNIVEGY